MSTKLMDALSDNVKETLRKEFMEEAAAATQQQKTAQAAQSLKKYFEKEKAKPAQKQSFIIQNTGTL